MAIRFDDIGNRLRAYRLGKALTAEQVAVSLGVSRAVIYRIEAGEVIKVETLERLASLLETSLGALLGEGVEYYGNAISYVERLRQLEEKSDQVIAHFPPLSYLLTSSAYPKLLKQALAEAMPSHVEDKKKYAAEIDAMIRVLDERKTSRQKRPLSLVNFISMPEIDRWLKVGMVGRFDLSPDETMRRRLAARAEIENLMQLIEREPMGVQIGLVEETLPNVAFQLFRTHEGPLLGLSSFRLGGDLPNIAGIAMITADAEPVRLYEQFIERLWRTAYKGREAISQLHIILERSGINPLDVRKPPGASLQLLETKRSKKGKALSDK